MAIYHLHARMIRRAVGQSVVATAAWQNACRLRDERLGQFSDFIGHRRIAFSRIVLPPDASGWLDDREGLWNAVEATEVRKDAQLARQFDVALPDEFDAGTCAVILQRFASQVMTERGYAVDMTLIETGDATTGVRHHGYVMMPTRPILGERFGPKDRVWNTRTKLIEIRAAWAAILNDRLSAHGVEARVDHRSNKDRGLKGEPGNHVGIVATQIARRARYSASA